MTEHQKIIVFDLDGTIAFQGNVVDSHIIQAIYEKQKQGYRIIFATGRPVRDALPLLPVDLHKETFIACNGSVIAQKGVIINQISFDTDEARSLVNFLVSKNLPFIIDGLHHYSISHIYHKLYDYIKQLSGAPESHQAVLDEKLTKVLVLSDTARVEVQQFLQMNKIAYELNKHSHDACFDVIPSGVSKYAGLRHIGVKRQTYIGFGNDYNDTLMLRNARDANVVGDFVLSADNLTRVAPADVAERIRMVV